MLHNIADNARTHFMQRSIALLKASDRPVFDAMLAAAVHPATEALVGMCAVPTVKNNVATCAGDIRGALDSTDVSTIAMAAHAEFHDFNNHLSKSCLEPCSM